MLVHVKRTRSYRTGERARFERRCSAKITAVDGQIESGRLVLLVRWESASAVALRRDTACVDLADAGSLPGQRKLEFLSSKGRAPGGRHLPFRSSRRDTQKMRDGG